jgi:hypothetical protein
MNSSTEHKLNVKVPAGIARGARGVACLTMAGAGEFTDGALAERWLR